MKQWQALVRDIPDFPRPGILFKDITPVLADAEGFAAAVAAMVEPWREAGLDAVVWCALVVAFASATQDIALDAFRIESADTQRQGALAATYQTGYRLAMIWAGAGVLWLAARAEVAGGGYQQAAWSTAYLVMAASMSVGVLTSRWRGEPARRRPGRAAGATASSRW